MKTKKLIASLLSCALVSAGIVIILFAFSEDIVHRNNGFIRRYPHHSVIIRDTINLKYNSYYFAGYENDIIYLGNTTAPLYVMRVNIKNGDTSHIDIEIPDFDIYNYRNLQLQIKKGKFYLYDGSVPVIFINDLGSPSENKLKEKIFFDRLVPIDSFHFWIRSRLAKTDQMEIGKLQLQPTNKAVFKKKLLTKKIDGYFDVDGLMTSSNNELLYIYFYRNRYLSIDIQGNLIYKGQTIDTLSQAKIEIALNRKRKIRKLASRPTIVNQKATSWDHYLFIQSNRLGKYEPKEMLENASIIDVYNFYKNTYEFSFYLYDQFGMKAREFRINGSQLFALYDKYLIINRINLQDKILTSY